MLDFFACSGRIGRARYAAYLCVVWIAGFIVLALFVKFSLVGIAVTVHLTQ